MCGVKGKGEWLLSRRARVFVGLSTQYYSKYVRKVVRWMDGDAKDACDKEQESVVFFIFNSILLRNWGVQFSTLHRHKSSYCCGLRYSLRSRHSKRLRNAVVADDILEEQQQQQWQ